MGERDIEYFEDFPKQIIERLQNPVERKHSEEYLKGYAEGQQFVIEWLSQYGERMELEELWGIWSKLHAEKEKIKRRWTRKGLNWKVKDSWYRGYLMGINSASRMSHKVYWKGYYRAKEIERGLV